MSLRLGLVQVISEEESPNYEIKLIRRVAGVYNLIPRQLVKSGRTIYRGEHISRRSQSSI